MDKKTKQLLETLRARKVGVFCDDSNLYHAYKKYGWRIDFGKFRNLLDQYCQLQFINYYLAIPRQDDPAYKGTMKFIEKIKPFVSVKKKALKYIQQGEKTVTKADVDVEITVDVVKEVDKLDVVIIMSGDSDFLKLKEYVSEEKGKQIIFAGYEENMAWELRQCLHLYINRIKNEVGL